MADILNDDPVDYALDPQIQDQVGGSVDAASGNEFRASLRSLNQLARGFAGLGAYNVRSVLEFGAVGDGVTDDYQAFEMALGSFGVTGGTLLVPPGTYLIEVDGVPPLTVPRFVHLKGAGVNGSVLDLRVAAAAEPAPGLRFQPSPSVNTYGRISDLMLRGDQASPTGIGLSFAGSQFNIATRIQIFNFEIGVDLSDGQTNFSAYNELSNFLISVARLGIRSHALGNGNWIERGRVHWAIGNPGLSDGIGIDVDGATALNIRSVAIEAANTCFRMSPGGPTTCEMTGCFLEPGEPPVVPPGSYQLFDVAYPSVANDPDGVTFLRFGPNEYSGNLGRIDVPPESLADFDAYSRQFFGARTHFAAHAHRQVSENHDLRLFGGPALIPGGWVPRNDADIDEETVDVFSGGRALRVTRTAGAGDGIVKHLTVPEDVDWVTVGFHYKSLSSSNVAYFATNETTTVNGVDTEGPSAAGPGLGYRERWLQLRKAPGSDPVVATMEVDHGEASLGTVLIDAIWCVPGRVRTSDFRYEQRVEYLERPQQIYHGQGVVADESWSVDWTGLGGLATAPRGAVGAVLAVYVTATRNDDDDPIPGRITVTVSGGEPPYEGTRVYAERDGRLATQQLAVRPLQPAATTLTGSFSTTLGAGFPTDYRIFVVGWILG